MSGAAKCYSPVTYRGKVGSLTCTATLLIYTPENQTTKECIWPCSTIQRHMIKSVGESKHMIRLIFVDQGQSPVILEVTKRDMVEQIRSDITQARNRLQQQQQQQAVNAAPAASAASASPTPSAPSPSSPRRANKTVAATTSPQPIQQSPTRKNQGRNGGGGGGSLAEGAATAATSRQGSSPERNNIRAPVEQPPASNSNNSPRRNNRNTSPNRRNTSPTSRPQQQQQRRRQRNVSPTRQSSPSPPPPRNRRNTGNASVPGAHSVSVPAAAASNKRGPDDPEDKSSSHGLLLTDSSNEDSQEFMRSVVRERQSIPGLGRAQSEAAGAAAPTTATTTRSNRSPLRRIASHDPAAPAPADGGSRRRLPQNSQRESLSPKPQSRRKPQTATTKTNNNSALPKVPLRATASQPTVSSRAAPVAMTAPPRRAVSGAMNDNSVEEYPDDLVIRAIAKERQNLQEVSPNNNNKRSLSRQGEEEEEDFTTDLQAHLNTQQRRGGNGGGGEGAQSSAAAGPTTAAARLLGLNGQSSQHTTNLIDSMDGPSPLPTENSVGIGVPTERQAGAIPVRGYNAPNLESQRTITIGDDGNDPQADPEQGGRPSTLPPETEEVLIEAHVVVDDSDTNHDYDVQRRSTVDSGLVEAKPMSTQVSCKDIMRSTAGRMAFVILALVMIIVIMAVVLALTLGGGGDDDDNNQGGKVIPIQTPVPSPTNPPGVSNLFLRWYEDELIWNSTILALQNPESPQSKAQDWVLDSHVLTDYTGRDWTLIQRFALAALYYSTQGKEWFNNTKWLSKRNTCAWHQDEDVRENGQTPCDLGKLSVLRLTGNNLVGELVPEIALLDGLEELVLTGHPDLGGTLPSTIGLLTDLTTLALSKTKMGGQLPSELGQLTSLEILELHSNDFSRPLPEEWGSLTNMKEFFIQDNEKIEGLVPGPFGDWKGLEAADLSNTGLCCPPRNPFCSSFGNPDIDLELGNTAEENCKPPGGSMPPPP